MNPCPCVFASGERRARRALLTSSGFRFRLGAGPRRGESAGVDFGCAWLTLELVRGPGLRADADPAVTAGACTGAPRRRCSCASLRGFYSVVDDVTLEEEQMPSIGQENLETVMIDSSA